MVFLSVSHFQAYQVGADGDDAKYLILAESIVSGHEYGMINVPGSPGATSYPFVYPVVLTMPVQLLPGNLDALKIPSLIATIANMALLFWGWRLLGRGRSYWWALAVTALYALSPLTIDLSRRVMSEPVFMTFCLSVLLLTEYRARGGKGSWWTPALSAALVLALFTRTVGIVLVLFVFAYLLFALGRRFWREAVTILVQSAILVGVIVATTPVQAKDLIPSGYLKDPNAYMLTAPLVAVGLIKPANTESAGQVGTRATGTVANGPKAATWLNDVIVKGFREHFGGDIRLVALPIGGGGREQALASRIGMPFLPRFIGFTISGLVLLGLLRSLASHRVSAFSLFAFAYLGSMFLWNWDDPRLIYPVEPQIQLGLLSGIEAVVLLVVSRVPQIQSSASVRNAAMFGIASILVSLSVYKSWQIEDTRLHVADLTLRTTWLKSNTLPSDIVMTEAPEVDFIYSGRMTVPYPPTALSPEELSNYLSRQNVRYTLVAPAIAWQQSVRPIYSPATARLLSALSVLSAQNRVEQVYSSAGGVQVYEVER